MSVLLWALKDFLSLKSAERSLFSLEKKRLILTDLSQLSEKLLPSLKLKHKRKWP